MDYSAIVNLVVQVVTQALPIGIIMTFSERLVQIFLSFAFPRWKGRDF